MLAKIIVGKAERARRVAAPSCFSSGADVEVGVMRKRLKQAAVLFVVIVAGAQLIRPGRTNPPIDASRTIAASSETPGALVAVLDRACRDCHSNGTVWPWYTQVAPLSWAMAYEAKAGRKAVNFSEWAGYSPAQQRDLLVQSCQDVRTGKMPYSAWIGLHPEAKLSAQDVETICAAARKAEAVAAHGP
jgi:hypothetical protein